MPTIKKYLSLDRLQEYDTLIKAEIVSSVSGKADSSHTHDDRYYTESEIDSKLDTVNASISSITSGTTVVKEAKHSETANTATRAESATTADSATKATQDGNGKVISTTYETKTDATTKLEEAKTYTDTIASSKADTNHNHDNLYDKNGSADEALESSKSYTDTKLTDMVGSSSVSTQIGNHNSSATAHSDIRALITELTTKLNNFLDVDNTTTDQLSEVLTLINNNKGTLESITSGKVNVSDIVDNLTTSNASKVLSAKQGVAIKNLIDGLQAGLDSHTHAIADVSGLQDALDGKASSSHGTHVTYSTAAPIMDGTASVGSAATVARSDHRHPTDTSRASQADLDALEAVVAGKANTSHTHSIDNVTGLQDALDAKAASSHNHTVSQISDLTATATELNYMDGVTSNVQTQLDGKAESGHGHSVASASANGFMSTTMFNKLSGIADGATKVTIDQSLSTTSANPVRNSVVATALNNASSAITNNTNSINSHTEAIAALQDDMDNIVEITSAEISALFNS